MKSTYSDLLRKSLLQNRELLTALNRAWPLLWPADLVADLWSVPAYLRMCAPWLSPADAAKLQRQDAQAWTVSDLPLLDAARQRLGDPGASRRKRRHDAAVAAEREQMTRVVDDLIEAADDEYGGGLVTMLRGEDFQDALVNEAAVPEAGGTRFAFLGGLRLPGMRLLDPVLRPASGKLALRPIGRLEHRAPGR